MLLTKTTEIAIQCLIVLARKPTGSLITPLPVSEAIGSSTSYTSKILRSLAKADLLVSHRGAAGGFSLSRDPAQITLLEIVEACEGTIVGNYCRSMETAGGTARTCGFHTAMVEFETAVREVLTKWTVEDMATRPLSDPDAAPNCKLRQILRADTEFSDDRKSL